MAHQYVILEHTVNGAVHFDLMLEIAGQDLLRTLQLARWPLAAGESASCSELAPHRRAYLTYEGEVSGGRGSVKRVETGTWSSADGQMVLQASDGRVTRLEQRGPVILAG
ncbi:MAG: hypothetical protein IT464_04970 [Planctomycetes bacterium]|nr:hypothetical protein [Planctomycetota bacterium]